jgi:hypothetical protein
MKKLKLLGKWLAFVSAGVALLPVALVLMASLIANLLGCNLNEAAAFECYVGGVDIGEALALMGVSGWFALLTLPIGGGLAVVGLLLYLIAFIALRRQNSVTSPEGAPDTAPQEVNQPSSF